MTRDEQRIEDMLRTFGEIKDLADSAQRMLVALRLRHPRALDEAAAAQHVRQLTEDYLAMAQAAQQARDLFAGALSEGAHPAVIHAATQLAPGLAAMFASLGQAIQQRATLVAKPAGTMQ